MVEDAYFLLTLLLPDFWLAVPIFFS